MEKAAQGGTMTAAADDLHLTHGAPTEVPTADLAVGVVVVVVAAVGALAAVEVIVDAVALVLVQARLPALVAGALADVTQAVGYVKHAPRPIAFGWKHQGRGHAAHMPTLASLGEARIE